MIRPESPDSLKSEKDMKKWIKTFRWNLGILILRIGYQIRGEIPMKNWGISLKQKASERRSVV